ncbi:M23 family metallopeptidase [Alistipes indistinctus]|uniref:M23 family metallopeptidase n=1 Tax=Alistipes indistinctus TaxID=626932 RepID=UPI0032BFDBA1
MPRQRQIDSLMCRVRTPRQMQQVIDNLKTTPNEMTAYPLLFPLDGRSCSYRISSGFGERAHPIYGDRRMHAGIDIAVSAGVPVYAAADGVVTRAGYDHGYGWMVEIRHRAGFITRYAHLSKVWLSAGDSVSIGEHLGNIGRSGIATGYHLHFEVRKDGRL